jgi:hypothetical protein
MKCKKKVSGKLALGVSREYSSAIGMLSVIVAPMLKKEVISFNR